MRLLQKVFIRSKEEQKEEMKLSYLCIMFFLYLSNIITAQEKDTITVLLIGDSTTKGATPRRVKPNGIHLEETIEQLSALEPFMPTVRVINSSQGGETALAVVESGRYKKEIYPLRERRIDYIFVRYGIYDWFKCKNLKNEFPENLKSLLEKIKTDFPEANLIPMTIVPFMPFDECEQVNELITEVAQEMNLTMFDIYTPYKKAVVESGPDTYHVRRIELNKVDKKYHGWLKPYTYDYKQKGKNMKVVLADDNSLDPILGKYKAWYYDRHPNLAGYHLIGYETVEFLKKKLNKTFKQKSNYE